MRIVGTAGIADADSADAQINKLVEVIELWPEDRIIGWEAIDANNVRFAPDAVQCSTLEETYTALVEEAARIPRELRIAAGMVKPGSLTARDLAEHPERTLLAFPVTLRLLAGPLPYGTSNGSP